MLKGGQNSRWDDMWTSMFGVLTRLSLDFRPDVRNSALRIVFNVVTEDGDLFDNEQWKKVVVSLAKYFQPRSLHSFFLAYIVRWSNHFPAGSIHSKECRQRGGERRQCRQRWPGNWSRTGWQGATLGNAPQSQYRREAVERDTSPGLKRLCPNSTAIHNQACGAGMVPSRVG